MKIRDRYIHVLRETLESIFNAATYISDTGKAVIITIEGTGLAVRIDIDAELDSVDMFTVSDRARSYAVEIWKEYTDAVSKITESNSAPSCCGHIM